MRRGSWWVVALALATCLAGARGQDDVEDAAFEEVEEDRAFLVARKFLTRGAGGEGLVKGRNETVIVEIFNAGSRHCQALIRSDCCWCWGCKQPAVEAFGKQGVSGGVACPPAPA